MMFFSKRGQALIEYVIIVFLITVVAVSVVKVFGGYLKDTITRVSCPFVGKIYIEGDSSGGGVCGTENDVWAKRESKK